MASSTSTMGKRVSAWLLVLVMLLSLLPTAALAADEEAPAQETAEPADTAEPTEPAEPDGAELLEIITPGDAVPVNAPTGTSEDPFLVSSEEELRMAVSADPVDDTQNHIRLAADITLTDSVKIHKSACIDLSGYKITYTGTYLAFDIYAALEVTDSSDAQTGAITSTAAEHAAEDEIPLAFYMNNGSSLRYSGGATSNFIHCVTVGPKSCAAVSMSGGSMSARKDCKDAVLLYGNGSSLSVGGGAVNGNIVVAGSGSDTNCQFCLSGGTVNGDVTLSMSQGANVTGSDNGITISAGTVNGNVTVGSRATGSLTISGGTVTGTVSKTASDAPATISVTGGTFPKCDVTAYLDADHVYNAETGAVTEYVAVYGDTRYADIDKALTAWAEGGGTLELLTDCTADFTEGLSVEKNAELRLGDKTLTLSHGYIAASIALTIQNGKIVVPSDGSYYAVCGYYGSNITLTNAEIEGQKNGAVTCSGTLTMDGGKLTGSGYGLSASGSGTFTVKSGEINILKASNQAAVILGEDGGTYTDLRVNTLSLGSNNNSVEFKSGIVGTLQTYYSPALTATENAYFVNRFTKGLPAGKTLTEVKKDGSTYYQLADLTAENAAAKVKAADGTETFYDDASVAAAALKAGGTLTLLRDHTGDTLRVRPGSGSVTIDLNNFTVTNKNGPGLYVVINGNLNETAPYTITVKNGTLASADSVALRADSVNNAADVVTENVTLTPGADHSPVELQDSARLVFTDETTAAQQLGTGYAVTADGKNYAFGIIGGLSYAVKTLPAEGGVVKLLNDYTGSEKMTYTDSTGKNVTLDLNGKTYNCTYAGVTAALEFNRPNSRLTVKNGKIISGGLYGVYAVASDYPNASANDLKLTLDGVTVSAPKGNGIGVNGVLTGNETVIRNSTVTSGDTGIYYPANGTLKIKDTTVTGEKLGVALKGGTAEISGEKTRIMANAAEKEPTDYYDGGNTGSILAEGYAVYMEGGYNRGISLTISGGTFTSRGVALKKYVKDTDTGYSRTISVSGGTFSSPVEKEYCTEGYEPVTNTDGTYGVGQVYRPVEVWTGYSGKKVASYSTAAEAAAHLGDNKWIVIGADYTLEADFVIPQDVRLDVAKDATLTIPAGVKLTVAADAIRFGVRTGAAVVNQGTILVCGTNYSKYHKSYVLLQDGGTLDTTTISVPDGYFLTHNNTNYYAAIATFEITYADGTTGMAGDQPTSTELAGAAKLTLLKDLSGFAYSFTSVDGLAENFVFDLGGHTLSGGGSAHTQVLTVGVPMTIQNGTIEYASNNTKYGAVKTLADVTFRSDLESDLVIRGGKGYGVWTEGYGHALTVNGTVYVQSDGSYAITGNGASVGGNVDVCNIVVNDGAKIEAPNGIGIYHPQLGTVTVKGGEITGSTGVQLCAGKLSMSGGSITSTGADFNASGSQNAMDDGAAISLVNRGYPGGTPSAEISGGTAAATGLNALAVKAYDYSNDSVKEWTKAGDNIQISGGTFSSPVKEEYCAEGYEPKDNTDGTYTVARKQTPTPTPTLEPSATPTLEPSATPTPTPTQKPTPKPTQKPTPKPTSSTWYPTYTTPAPVKSSAIPVTVKGTQFTVNGAAKQESLTGSYAKLSTVTVKYTGSEEFVCWVNASGNIVTTEKSFRLTVVGKTELTAITCGKDRKSGETLLVYENAAENGQLVHTETVTAESVASEKFAFPAPAVMPGREFTYWTVEIGGERVEATADVLKAQIESGAKALILTPEYEAAGTYRVQLLCTDEAGAELQTPVVYTGMETGMLKYVTAPDISGYTFSCWKDETGRAVGTNRKYAAFSADADALVTLTAVYVPAGQTAAKNEICVTLSLTDAAKTDGAGTISFAAIFSVPDNRTVVKRGFLYTDNSRKTLTCENAEDLKTFEWDSETENCGRMVVTLGLKDTLCAVYVRAFAVLDDGTVVYSDMVSYSVDTAIDAAETAADAELPKDNAETVETEGDAFCDAGSVTTKW